VSVAVTWLKRVLVTGASGLLGCRLVEVLSEKYDVIPTHNTHSLQPNSTRMDVVDRGLVFKVLKNFRPSAVVHTAAETNVDKCERDKVWACRVNVEGTRNVAEGCMKIGVKLIYVSTDYVFDGEKGLYSEDDNPSPINHYGLTKLEGERAVQESGGEYVIARASVLYGWHPRKLNFATWVIDSLRSGKRINVVDDHYNSPTHADNLAEMILAVLKKDLSGVYHAAGGERVSRYGFAIRLADIFELNKSLIIPVSMDDLTTWVARRPRDSSLSTDKITRDTGVQALNLNEALKILKNSAIGTGPE